jgi:SNF2 family DNA or RNA helicase
MDSSIGFMGYSIPLAKLPPHFLEEIRSELTVKPLENPNFSNVSNSEYPIFRISKTNVYLPRSYGLQKFGPAKSSIKEPSKINLTFNGTLRPVQQTAVDETLKRFETDDCGGIIVLDTGLGKTVVALNLISLTNVKTLILVHAEFLLEQWVERIKQYLPTARIGIIQQERCEYQDVDICVGMIQSITQRNYPKECFKSYPSFLRSVMSSIIAI